MSSQIQNVISPFIKSAPEEESKKLENQDIEERKSEAPITPVKAKEPVTPSILKNPYGPGMERSDSVRKYRE